MQRLRSITDVVSHYAGRGHEVNHIFGFQVFNHGFPDLPYAQRQRAFLRADMARWGKIIREKGIKEG